MREAWVNVYEYRNGGQMFGRCRESREEADRWATPDGFCNSRRVLVLRVRERLPTGRRTPKFDDMKGT